jgi:hypothetical protein
MKSTSEVPPELKKGSDTPVGGTEEVTTATLRRLCTAISEVMPTASRCPSIGSSGYLYSPPYKYQEQQHYCKALL